MTSHDVVAYVRRLTGERKVGHAGTLDPPAAGVLLVLVGRAGVRLAEYLLELEKVYLAEVRFGRETDTQDYTGRAGGGDPAGVRTLTRRDVECGLSRFVGRLEQIPPMVSAVKVGGERLHRLAREGREVKRPARAVHIHNLELVEFAQPVAGGAASGDRSGSSGGPARDAPDVLPTARLRVRCSRGTYVRTLAHDLGRALGVGAHLGFLVREAVGAYSLERSLTLEELSRAAAEGTLEDLRVPPAEAVAHLPSVHPRRGDLERLVHGEVVEFPDGRGSPPQAVRVLSEEGTLVALADLSGGRLRPRKVLVSPAGGERDA